MKLTKKKLFVIALAACLVAILSMGSLAWFSAQDAVTNDFLIADSDDDADDIFSVDVWENTPDGIKTDGYTYEKVLPGASLVKEAHVENTGMYSQYIRVIVTISGADVWNQLDVLMADVFEGFNEADWNNITMSVDANANTISYVLYYNNVLEAGDDITLFEKVNVPGDLTLEQSVALGNNFSIVVKAQAVQSDNMPNNAYDAFEMAQVAIN